jgi:FeoB-associated Cys-rich membrane protein
MGWQVIAVLLIVAVAAAYLVHAAWRALTGRNTGCGGGCRCASEPASKGEKLIPSEQLTLRRGDKSPP